jgi:serine/threonine-protein kinase RsbW
MAVEHNKDVMKLLCNAVALERAWPEALLPLHDTLERMVMEDADGLSRTFGATPEGIMAADAWIEEVGRRWGIAERTIFGVRICVAEVAANVLEHGTLPPKPAEFSVMLRRSGSGLEVEIADSGRPFDLTAAPATPVPRTLEEAEIGGLGLRLIRSYAADITYRHDGVQNRLRLRIPAASA